MRIVLGTILVAALAVAIGCEGNISTAPETADMGGSAPPPPDPTPPNGQAAPGEQAETAAASNPQTPEADTPEAGTADDDTADDDTADRGTPEPASEPADGDDGSTEVATAASGAKGRDYGGPGIITTPIQQYFRADARINFIQMANALKIYKAGHDNKGPKTHDEFMDVIVKENGVQLPELPTGDEYFYDVKTEQLMVRHPEK
jgi:hypothetical protein